MNYARFAAAPALLLALILAGCGLTSSPADNLTFKAPKGWSGSPGIMGFMQFWKAPGSDEVLMVFRSPKPLKTTEVFNSADLRDAKVENQKAITICGSQPAEFFKAQGTSKGGHDSNIEMVMTNAGGATYMAMYVYPVGIAVNADAEAALRQLCTK
ncbi:MAG TPA: hypothetical protein VGF86_16230 [Candidatus Tumulicola sp.]|jgi:hypothetical protein